MYMYMYMYMYIDNIVYVYTYMLTYVSNIGLYIKSVLKGPCKSLGFRVQGIYIYTYIHTFEVNRGPDDSNRVLAYIMA